MMDQFTEFPEIADTLFTRDEVIALIRSDRTARAPHAMSHSGWIQTVPAAGPTSLQWDEPQRQPGLDIPERTSSIVGQCIHLHGQITGHSDTTWEVYHRCRDCGHIWSTFDLESWEAVARRVVFAEVDKSLDLQGKPVDEIAKMHGQVVDAEFPGTPTVAECITQLDVWNGHLEAAIDRQAHQVLGQHPNDEPADARDPMEQLP